MDIAKLKTLRSEGHSLSQISKLMGCSLSSIKNYIREHKIEKSDNKPDKIESCNCGNKLKGNQTKFCSDQCKLKSFLDSRGKRNVYHYQKTKGHELKKKIVDLKGGCCEQCGYSKSLRALTFHHRDPEYKSFHLNVRILSQRSMKSILEELSKCDLLCFNCHMELHDNELVGRP